MNSIHQGGARLGGSEQKCVMQSSGPTTNEHCFFYENSGNFGYFG